MSSSMPRDSSSDEKKVTWSKTAQYTFFTFVCYNLDDLDRIIKDENVRNYALIKHQPEADKKAVHWHIIVRCENKTTWTMWNEREFLENVIIAPAVYRAGAYKMYEYLIHKNNPEKIQYKYEDIVSDDKQYWESLKTVGSSTRCCSSGDNLSFLDDLLNLSPFDMAVKYGRDYIKNYTKYRDFREIIKRSTYERMYCDKEIIPIDLEQIGVFENEK